MKTDKLNIFSKIPASYGVIPTAESGRKGFSRSSSSQSCSFTGQTSGINDAITGSSVYAAGQVGKAPAILGQKGQWIA